MYASHLEKASKMLANALTLEEISIARNSAFTVMVARNMMALDGEVHMTSGIIFTSS